jgi:hypothetical protein
MATRRQIREAFYSELETAVGTLLDSDDITQEYPDSAEDLPRIVHNDNYRKVPMNAPTGPTGVDSDAAGEQAYIYAKLMEAQFTVLVVAEEEDAKEDIYEAVRTYFEDFEDPTRDEDEIQSDVHDVEVGDANSQDSENRDPPARGDSMRISLGYQRKGERDTTPVDSIDAGIDVDDPETSDDTIGDGTEDISYEEP